jgi:hypothetical protein
MWKATPDAHVASTAQGETRSTPMMLLLLGGLLILISYGVASLWLAIKEYVQ